MMVLSMLLATASTDVFGWLEDIIVIHPISSLGEMDVTFGEPWDGMTYVKGLDLQDRFFLSSGL